MHNFLVILLDLIKQSVIVQGLVTTAFVLTVCYLWATGKPIPPDLLGFTSLILGFYFGAKVQYLVGKKNE